MLASYEEIAKRLTSRDDRVWQLQVAELAIAQARAAAEYWAAIAAACAEPDETGKSAP
jgi:hypothetical protein